jgi:hypothetical protein
MTSADDVTMFNNRSLMMIAVTPVSIERLLTSIRGGRPYEYQ